MIHSSCWLSPWFLLKEEHAKAESHVNICLLLNTDCHFPVSCKLHPVLTLLAKLTICAPKWTYEMQIVTSSLLLFDVTNINILCKVAATRHEWPKMLNWDKLPLNNSSVQPSSFCPCWTSCKQVYTTKCKTSRLNVRIHICRTIIYPPKKVRLLSATLDETLEVALTY